ncbi:hypothetical protein [Mycobacterium vulneris]
MTAETWCPQRWGVFSVRGTTGIYEVRSDHVLQGTWRCDCKTSTYDRPDAGCKHIKRVLKSGCLAGPDRSAGPNNLGAAGVSIVGAVYHRGHERTRRRCACGEMMLAPLLRTNDGAGHQIIELQFDGGSTHYAYAWRGLHALSMGDRVTVSPLTEARATVVTLGSDYIGPLTVIGENQSL